MNNMMRRPRNYYDNLKVAMDAPAEVIRAAYKVLCQKYHSDINGDTERNKRAMQIINNAYDVLSDPVKRKEHDEWIKQQEILFEQDKTSRINEKEIEQTIKQNEEQNGRQTYDYKAHNQKKNFNNYIYPIIAILVIGSFVAEDVWKNNNKRNVLYNTKDNLHIKEEALPSTYADTPQDVVLEPDLNKKTISSEEFMRGLDEIDREKRLKNQNSNDEKILEPEIYKRPDKAPNGASWPDIAGYITGYPIKMDTGLSSVKIDNSKNNADVFVKLFRHYYKKKYPVRTIFIPALGAYTLTGITAGDYDIRYQDLDSGALSKTDKFTLYEIETYSGIQYSKMTLTLYKVQHGNMQMQKILPEDFE